MLAETDPSGNLIREFIYFNGGRVARRESNGTVYYFFSDRLGTARVMTNATGVTQQEPTYYPFGGEQRQIVNTVDNRYKFTGMERDGQTGLDHTQYREYSPMLARWLSPDPICANCYDPQNLNRYSYVRNDPVNLVDPDGRNFMPGMCSAEYSYYDCGGGGGGYGWSTDPFQGDFYGEARRAGWEPGMSPDTWDALQVHNEMIEITRHNVLVRDAAIEESKREIHRIVDAIVIGRVTVRIIGAESESDQFQSAWYLSWVPGQAAWDRAVNSANAGNYIGAAANTAAMLGEQVLTALTLGNGQVATNSLLQFGSAVRTG